ncbi:hypothetical protein AN958_04774 [Leucoagaricus sp. SymC.cos]|nr:hypothetical protein AN958_04774 [Leucoagaricus sp. SymC.cos]
MLPQSSSPPVDPTFYQDPHRVPSIRLISAIPSAAGMSSDVNTAPSTSFDSSWQSISPSTIAPKPDVPVRKRLVPKKSKLGLLGAKDKAKDLSDVARRVGVDSPPTRGGFDIYVDPTPDPELGDIVVIKKQKSRGALNGVNWGALGEVTNVPNVPRSGPIPSDTLKAKDEDKKWWTIGRGRKDSKEKKGKENTKRSKSPALPPRSKTPDPFKPSQDSRTRFNSFDSKVILNGPIDMGLPKASAASEPDHFPRLHPQRSFTPGSLKEACRPPSPVPPRPTTPSILNGLLAPTLANDGAKEQGSIALRAIRSVKSLARIGNWAQMENQTGTLREKEKKERKEKKEKRERKEEKVKEKEKERKETSARTLRLSTSSFEAGALTSPGPEPQTLGKKKRSILGLGIGLPSSIRLPPVRNGSTASSILQPTTNTLSVDGLGTRAKERMGSTISTASSLRPMSMASSSGASSTTRESRGSVKWDEEGLQNVKKEIQKEKKEKRKKRKEEGKESKRSSEGRRRISITDVFPDVASGQGDDVIHADQDKRMQKRFSTAFPIVTIEEATADGHDADTEDIHNSLVYGGIVKEKEKEEGPQTTPVKRQRVRPMSEQLLRPRAVYENEEGVLSILDAATNDLAQLINNLDLEATPNTPDLTPLRPAPLPTDFLNTSRLDPTLNGSPLKKPQTLGGESPLKDKSPSSTLKLRASTASITSLRPYAQSRGKATRTLTTPVFTPATINSTGRKNPSERGIGQPIKPWPPEPAPVFQPLRPPKARTIKVSDAIDGKATLRPSASSIFAPAVDALKNKVVKNSASPPPSLGRRASAFLKKHCSLLPVPADTSMGDSSFACAGPGPDLTNSSILGGSTATNETGSPEGIKVPAEKQKQRKRMPGTLGGSDVSCYAVPELDASDPDSDIPDELQSILKTNRRDREEDDGDTFEMKRRFVRDDDDSGEIERPRSLLPPLAFSDLPSEILKSPIFSGSFSGDTDVLRDIDEGVQADVEFDPESDTKQSFDFTGELQKLNESGASNRDSFVEQLENAFKTPAMVDLRCDFGGLLQLEVPPVPRLPLELDPRGHASRAVSLKFSKSSRDTTPDKCGRLQVPPSVSRKSTSEESEPEAFDPQKLAELVDGTVRANTSRDTSTQTTSMFDMSFGADSADETGRIFVSADPTKAFEKSTSSTQSHRASPSNGELNKAFKFGGLSRQESSEESPEVARRAMPEEPLTLSDIIPPPSHVRSLSSSTASSALEDDSLFKSILAKSSNVPQPRPRVASDASNSFLQARRSIYRHSQASSASSFSGFDSFEEVRRGFEFNSQRPGFYPPASSNRRPNRQIRESVMSFASVSSYGRVINPGVPDPFDFGLPRLRERPTSEAMSTFSIDDTFSFLKYPSRIRRRVDSDASSFYLNAPASRPSDHRYSSNFSVPAQAPPVSLYNRGFGAHRRNNSSTSLASRSIWRSSQHSIDSVMSDFSAMRLGRPGIGDKMFETADQAVPLSSISASPPGTTSESFSQQVSNQPNSYDSVMDDDRRVSLDATDSIFEKTGQRTSVISEKSFFGHDGGSHFQPGLLPPYQFRPMSLMSMASVHSPVKDDDTMISMLGGGHVRRRSIGSIMHGSPCARAEKRKHATYQEIHGGHDEDESPNKARLVEGPSFNTSCDFGSERMEQAHQGLLRRGSLEDSCLVGDGEDFSVSFRPVPVFTRPPPASRSRSSTFTSSSGGDTPPLLASDGSSISGSSLASFDLSEVNVLLNHTTHPPLTMHSRARARPRGQGHRRRYSHVRLSRAESAYETIQEELPSLESSPSHSVITETTADFPQDPPVFIVDGDTAKSEEQFSFWDDEQGIIALRRYYALQDEARSTITESQRIWSDTPFSLFAVQSFKPPHHAEGMKALLEHSVQNYGPLPSELRPRRARSRRDSRPSPYPQSRPIKVFNSPEPIQPSTLPVPIARPPTALTLQVTAPPAPVFSEPPRVFPDTGNLNTMGSRLENLRTTKSRVGSNAKRTGLGWTKRESTNKGLADANAVSGKPSISTTTASTDQKENVGMGSITSENSLRLNRPRPKGRPTSIATRSIRA